MPNKPSNSADSRSSISSSDFSSYGVLPFTILAADVGGKRCPCTVLVSFLSGFSGKSCPVSVRCPDSVWIIEKAARCLSVRPDQDQTELSGFSPSLSAESVLQSFKKVDLENFPWATEGSDKSISFGFSCMKIR